MPTRLLTIPFVLGQDEETAFRELPQGSLREALNVRQRRGSALGIRPDYPAVLMTEFGGSMIPYDVWNMNGRLFALGDRQGQGHPTDVFEYVVQPAGAWKGTLAPAGIGHRVPSVANIRNVGQPPDGIAGVRTARVAAVNGLVCLTYGFGGTVGGSTSYVHIFSAATDSTIVFAPVPLSNTRAVVAGNSLWILGVDAASDLIGYRFDTTADAALRAPVTLYTGTVTATIYAACTVDAVVLTQFAVIVRDGSITVVRRFNEAGAQQQTFAGPAVAADVLQLDSDSVANQHIVAYRVGAADAFTQTFNLTSGASIVGPTAAFGQVVQGDISLCRYNTGVNGAFLTSEDATNLVRRFAFNPTTNVGVLANLNNFAVAGRGVGSALGVIQPLISQTSNELMLYDTLSSQTDVSAVLDQGIATDPPTVAGMGGDSCRDKGTGKYYWARLIVGTDAQEIPIVAEFTVGSTGRRQACQIGNELFITGGMPLVHDGRQLSENAFPERPAIVSITNTTGGSLIPGAQYDYIAIWRWTDSQNLEAKSMLSAITTVTQAALQTANTALVYSPHTLRRDANTGSAVTISLYRTDANLTVTPPVIIGNASIDPPTAPLVGLTLRLNFFDGAGTLYLVTFSAGATTMAAILAEINAVTGADVVASAPSGLLTLTGGQSGSTILLQVLGSSTAKTILGLDPAPSATGTSVFTKGSVFRLTACAPVPIADEVGLPVSLFDSTSDTAILTKEALYTEGERGALTGILEHESAPPCKFCWTIGSRVFVGGLPDPSEVAISKERFPAEGLAFSSNFSFRSRVDGAVTAVAGLDGTPVVFTADSIYRFVSDLPDDSGSSGELGAPVKLPSEGGLIDNGERSLLETTFGLFYQARDTKLMVLPRGGGVPAWVGKSVQDTLALFPVITAAAYVDVDTCAIFACQNTGGTATTFLVFDLRVGQWYRDTFSSAQVVSSAVDYLGRLAYIDRLVPGAAAVHLQSLSLTPATFLDLSVKTGVITPFEWGKFVSITLHGEFRQSCQFIVRISYNEGVSFTNLKTFTLNAGYTQGDTFDLQWWPSIRKGSSYVLQFALLTNGIATEGVILNRYVLELDEAAPVKRQRLGVAFRG